MFSIKKKKVHAFVYAYLYLCIVAVCVAVFNLSLYTFTFWYMLAPALYVGLVLRREGRMAWESLIISVPTILTVDLLGHVSGSWDYWRSEIFGMWIGPYPLIGFFWGFSFWLAMVTYYEYFFDKSYSRITPYSQKIFFIVASSTTIIFLLLSEVTPIRYFYAIFISIMILLNIFLIRTYHYPFWKSFLPTLLLVPASLMYEWVSLRNGHWVFDTTNSILPVPFFGYVLPVEEFLWFFVVQYTVILFHETVSDNQRIE